METSPYVVSQINTTNTIGKEMVPHNMHVFKDVSVTMHHSSYNQQSKKLSMYKIKLKGRKEVEMNDFQFDDIDIKPSGALMMCQATFKFLEHVVDKHE